MADQNYVKLTDDSESGIPLDDISSSKSWSARTFGKMNQGSLRGSIFTLVSTAMGAGYMAIPKVLEYTGLFFGLFLILISALIMYKSLQTLSRAAFRYNAFHYASIVEKMFGKKMGNLLELAVICNAIGLIIGYNIIVSTLVPSILTSWNVNWDTQLERGIVILFINFCIIIPLGLKRDLGALRFKALFNVTALTLVSLIIIIEFPFFVSQNDYKADIKYINLDINFFEAFALPLLAYLSHQNLCRIQSELIGKTQDRMNKVISRSVIIMCTLFTAISFFAYMSLLGDTPDIVIMREAPDSIENDWAMVVCRCLISLTLTIGVPLNLNPCRISIEKLCFSREGDTPLWLHVIITLSCVIVTMTVAIFFPNIRFVFSFLGGFCGTIMAIIIPGLMYIKMTDEPYSSKSNIIILSGICILSLIGFTSIAINIINAVRSVS